MFWETAFCFANICVATLASNLPMGNRYKQGQREVWVQERAEHIPWIIATLTDPGTEMFPNDQDPYNRVNAASSTAQQLLALAMV